MKTNPLGDSFIERNVFINTPISVAVGIPNRVFILNNAFTATYSPPMGFYGVEVSMSGDPNCMVITKNSFLNNSFTALAVSDGYSSGKMTATENYWNTTDSGVIDSMIHDKNDNIAAPEYIIYTPYLTSPDPATPTY